MATNYIHSPISKFIDIYAKFYLICMHADIQSHFGYRLLNENHDHLLILNILDDSLNVTSKAHGNSHAKSPPWISALK